MGVTGTNGKTTVSFLIASILDAAGKKPALFGTISQVAENVARGAKPAAQAAWGLSQLERAGFTRVDYLTVRDATTLAPVADASLPARVLAAVWLGQTRLIDNVSV